MTDPLWLPPPPPDPVLRPPAPMPWDEPWHASPPLPAAGPDEPAAPAPPRPRRSRSERSRAAPQTTASERPRRDRRTAYLPTGVVAFVVAWCVIAVLTNLGAVVDHGPQQVPTVILTPSEPATMPPGPTPSLTGP